MPVIPCNVSVIGLLLLLLILAAATGLRLSMGSRGRYCRAATFGEAEARSPLQCARLCSGHRNCVSFSLRGTQCLFHNLMCGADNLVEEEGSYHVGVKWECLGSSCYSMPTLKTPMGKPAAVAHCASMGAHILAPESARENEYIKSLIRQDAYFPAPGFNDWIVMWLDVVNDRIWEHSGEVLTYTNWKNGTPNPTSKTCSRINFAGLWQDAECSWYMAFICEKEG